MENCKNCGTKLNGKYCYVCGQEKITKRMSINSLFHDFLHSTFHWESTLIHTVKELAVSPGEFVRSYIDGKRKSYAKPVSFFILTTTVFVIVFHLFSDNFITFVNETLVGDKINKPNPMGIDIVAMQHLVLNKINYFYFVIAPIFAGWFMLFFRKMKLNFAEALVFSFYTIGMGLFISLFLVLFALINVKFWSFRLIITIVYYVYACVKFSNTNTVTDIFKSIGVVLLTFLTFGIVIIAALVGYLSFTH